MSIYNYGLTPTSVVLRFKLLDSTATTGAGKTGLSSSSSGLIIAVLKDSAAAPTLYRQSDTTIETIATLGTYAAPTATKCRFKEIDSTNMPGWYEFQFDNSVFSACQYVGIAVSGVTALAQADFSVDCKNLKSDFVSMLGTLLTETVGGYLVAAFKKFFDIATPVATVASANQTGDSFALIGTAGGGLTAIGDTRIANLDATITSRLAPAGTLATVTTLTNMPDVNVTKIAGVAAAATALSAFTEIRIQVPTGAAAVTVTVTDGADPIADVQVQIINSGGDTIANMRTNANGQIAGVNAFKLDIGTYTVRLSKSAVTFADQTLTVAGDMSVTYTGTPFSPSEPVVGDQTLYGFVKHGSGLPASSSVIRATPVIQNQFIDGVQITLYPIETTADSVGYWEMGLVKGAKFKIESSYDGKYYYIKTVVISTAATSDIDSYE